MSEVVVSTKIDEEPPVSNKTKCKHLSYEINETTRQCRKCFLVETYDGEKWINHPHSFDFLLDPEKAKGE